MYDFEEDRSERIKQAYDQISPLSLHGHEHSPIIFLHGIFDSRKTWKKTAPAIAKITNRKVYLLDARNHGESPRADKMNYDCLTDDVINFMNEQNIRKAIIIGNSMGGRTAINIALKHPTRVEMLIVEEMSPNNLHSGKDTILSIMTELMLSFLKQIPPEMDENSAKQMILDTVLTLVPQKYFSKEKIYENYDLDMMPLKKIGNNFEPEADVNAGFKLIHSDSLNQKLPESNLRFYGDTLFIYGSKGLFKIEKDPTIKKLFPRAVLKRIEGASHLAHCDSPQEFVNIVSDFILYRTASKSKY